MLLMQLIPFNFYLIKSDKGFNIKIFVYLFLNIGAVLLKTSLYYALQNTI